MVRKRIAEIDIKKYYLQSWHLKCHFWQTYLTLRMLLKLQVKNSMCQIQLFRAENSFSSSQKQHMDLQ